MSIAIPGTKIHGGALALLAGVRLMGGR